MNMKKTMILMIIGLTVIGMAAMNASAERIKDVAQIVTIYEVETNKEPLVITPVPVTTEEKELDIEDMIVISSYTEKNAVIGADISENGIQGLNQKSELPATVIIGVIVLLLTALITKNRKK
jgi:hypothetical protein